MTTKEQLERLTQVLKDTKRLVVLTHDNPDPDCVSSAFALAYWVKEKCGIPTTVRYSGIIGRSENQAMIRVLGLRMALLKDSDFRKGTDFALVDMQPKTGNSAFPKKRKPLIVIDHHPQRKATKADYIDIRTDYGATATILTEYLTISGVEISSKLATALSYGISSETQDLGREAREPDIQAYRTLFSKSNKKKLAQIVHPRLPREYFISLNRALHHSRVYKNAIVSTLGPVQNPDFVPFIADFMLRCERINWALCLGRYGGRIIVSIRTTNIKGEAGRFLRNLIGSRGTAGGHGMMAGGQVQCDMEHESCNQTEESLVQSFLKKLGYPEGAEMTPLLLPEPIGD